MSLNLILISFCFREKLDILIDENELKDENEENIPKEAYNMPGYDMLSDRERRVGIELQGKKMCLECRTRMLQNSQKFVQQ